jgi:hypothetical protein
MRRTSPRLKGKEMAVEYRFLLLPLPPRQLSPTPDERHGLVATRQQPVQACRQFEVHPVTPFYLLPLPQPATKPVVHNR